LVLQYIKVDENARLIDCIRAGVGGGSFLKIAKDESKAAFPV
jgi:hypothetical protein